MSERKDASLSANRKINKTPAFCITKRRAYRTYIRERKAKQTYPIEYGEISMRVGNERCTHWNRPYIGLCIHTRARARSSNSNVSSNISRLILVPAICKTLLSKCNAWWWWLLLLNVEKHSCYNRCIHWQNMMQSIVTPNACEIYFQKKEDTGIVVYTSNNWHFLQRRRRLFSLLFHRVDKLNIVCHCDAKSMSNQNTHTTWALHLKFSSANHDNYTIEPERKRERK